MIIKYNFRIEENSSKTSTVGTLKITTDKVASPIYELVSNADATIEIKDVLKQYSESRIFEIFNQARTENTYLSSDDYLDILKNEVPASLAQDVINEMQSFIEYDNVRQAS
ncbi:MULTISPECIES: hypothetical protein [Flammeovirga]|uniref:Uncharacterized protein n=1 Tax=Flammeovirga agarivorans TaxID=2726742 RepID=A0A7X8XU62_9BACT|nr:MULTISPECIES: hypothetical protein [Flammeovirga]NLR90077.1 hypothetical protein [Flammeovirga agarivorans]